MTAASRVLIVVDRKDWAFDRIAKAIIQYNESDITYDIAYLKGGEPLTSGVMSKYDRVFFMHWSLCAKITPPIIARVLGKKVPFAKNRITSRFPDLDLSKVITGIHGHHDHDDRLSMPDKEIVPPQNVIEFLKQFRAVNAVSNRLVRCFTAGGLEGVVCTENGVDTDVFKLLRPVRVDGKLRVGCSGTKKRDWKEGITEFIEPLADLPFVELHIATPEDGRYVPADKMPEFLNDIDIYVLASSTEGFPLKALEACSCGRAVVTTKVGGLEDMIVNGENGYFVDRNLEAIKDRLRYLNEHREEVAAMGNRNREIVEQSWSWKVRAQGWLDFVQSNL